MTVFRGARDMDTEEPSQLDLEWFARIAEIDGHALFSEPPPIRRRRYGQAIARGIVALAVAVAVAWLLSEIAVAALLDETRLLALGIVP